MKYICGSCWEPFATAEECSEHIGDCDMAILNWDLGYVYGMIEENN